VTPLRVFLVDDHPIVRYGFAQLLAVESDIVVCGEAVSARQAIDGLATNPDVMVVDLSLGTSDGIDLIKEIKDRQSRIAVLVVSMHDEMLYAERSLRAGAAGYVMKHEATESIVRAIRTVAAGGVFVSEAVSARVLQKKIGAKSRSAIESLSDRELYVFQLMGRGLGTRAIAEHLHVSIKTVESYRARLKEKMNLRSGTELMRFAVRWAEDKESGG
jgi:DNA-binding NarL/FixJ family response regulator